MTFEHRPLNANRSHEEARILYEQRIRDATSIWERYRHAFTSRPCPFCGEREPQVLDPFRGTYGVARCGVCASLYVDPCPPVEALDDYYNQSECSRQYTRLTERNRERGFISDQRVSAIARLLPRERTGTLRILEVGCNAGSFLSRLADWLERERPGLRVELVGTDVDREAVGRCADARLDLRAGSTERLVESSLGPFDLVVHFELVEHLIDPGAFVRSLHDLLTPDGRVLFTTPNADGLEMAALGYNDYRPLAHAIFPPLHLNAFSTRNVLHFAVRHGFCVRELATPGQLDVAILEAAEKSLSDPLFARLASEDEQTKGFVQALVRRLGASGHLQCVLSARAGRS